MADDVLYMGVRGVTDLMVAPGLVNLDFADIRTVMAEMGKAMMGTGEAEGENRAIRAAEAAISNPLLEDTCMAGARGLLINITGGEDMTLFEVDQAANRIREEVDEDANIIFGSAIDENLDGKIRVSVVATGIETPGQKQAERPRLVAVGSNPPLQGVPAQIPAVAGGAGPAPLPPRQGMTPPPMTPGLVPGMIPQRPGAGQQIQQMRPTQQTVPSAHTMAPQPAALQQAPAHAPVQAPAQAPVETAVEASAMEATPAEAHGGGSGYPVIDDRPVPRQPIPSHLQQPLRPEPARQRQPASTGGLFAQPTRAEPSAPPPPARRSLFGIVTGRIRASLPGAAAADPHAADAFETAAQAAPQEARHGHVTPAADPEMGLDIPAFLRRQSS